LKTSPPSNKKQIQSFLGKVNFHGRFISNLLRKTKVFSPLLRLKDEVEFRWEKEHQEVIDNFKRYLTNLPVLVPLVNERD